jgi:hypothetical protein
MLLPTAVIVIILVVVIVGLALGLGLGLGLSQQINNTFSVPQPLRLEMHDSPVPKVRLGPTRDGAYVVSNLPRGTYDYFLSAGVGKNVDFEHALLDLHPDLRCTIFDGTVSGLPRPHARMEFRREMVGAGTFASFPYRNMFLKMDIEGAEYAWLEAVSFAELECFAQITMELHEASRSERRRSLVAKLLQTHRLVHLHANNNGSVLRVNGSQVPALLEVTLLRADLAGPVSSCPDEIPGKLDKGNTGWARDITLDPRELWL